MDGEFKGTARRLGMTDNEFARLMCGEIRSLYSIQDRGRVTDIRKLEIVTRMDVELLLQGIEGLLDSSGTPAYQTVLDGLPPDERAKCRSEQEDAFRGP